MNTKLSSLSKRYEKYNPLRSKISEFRNFDEYMLWNKREKQLRGTNAISERELDDPSLTVVWRRELLETGEALSSCTTPRGALVEEGIVIGGERKGLELGTEQLIMK